MISELFQYLYTKGKFIKSSKLPNQPVTCKAAIHFHFRRSQRASDDLADFFQIAESTTLFKYPESEIVEDDEESEEEMGDQSTSSMNLQIMAVLVLIIGIILAIFLQEK